MLDSKSGYVLLLAPQLHPYFFMTRAQSNKSSSLREGSTKFEILAGEFEDVLLERCTDRQNLPVERRVVLDARVDEAFEDMWDELKRTCEDPSAESKNFNYNKEYLEERDATQRFGDTYEEFKAKFKFE